MLQDFLIPFEVTLDGSAALRRALGRICGYPEDLATGIQLLAPRETGLHAYLAVEINTAHPEAPLALQWIQTLSSRQQPPTAPFSSLEQLQSSDKEAHKYDGYIQSTQALEAGLYQVHALAMLDARHSYRRKK